MARDDLSAISSALRPVLRVSGIVAALAILCLAIIPVRLIAGGPSFCLIKNIFGVPCYGCGMTRALSCLLHGDLPQAVAYNRGSLAVLPLLALVAASGFWRSTPPR